MELLYLYIPDYSIFKDAQINFTGKYKFNYDKNTRSLTCNIDENAIDGSFFSINNTNNVVTNISALIGNNGSGKTTIADFLHLIRIRSGLEHIVVWKIDDVIKCSSFILPENLSNSDFNKYLVDLDNTSESIRIRAKMGKSEIEMCYEKKDKSKYQLNRNSHLLTKLKQRLIDANNDWSIPIIDDKNIKIKHCPNVENEFTFVYLSNFFASLHSIEDMNGTIDLSTSYLAYKDKETLINSMYDNHIDSFVAHRMMEMVRNVKLFSTFKSLDKKPKWKLPVPTGLSIKPLDIDLKTLRTELGKINEKQSELAYEFLLFINATDLENNNSNNKFSNSLTNFTVKLFRAFLGNYFRYYPIDKVETGHISTILIEQFKRFSKDGLSIENIKNFCIEILKSYTIDKNGMPQSPIKYFLELINVLEMHSDNLFFENFYYNFNKNEDLEKSILVLKTYFSTNTITHYLDFAWEPRISSGELAQLNLYSRLFSLLQKGSIIDRRKVLLFVDEIEITIHPDLQRKLVSNLMEFLGLFFKENKFHIIFASHSPILLSDIPMSQTVLLKRTDTTVELITTNKSETFGANIHTLYENSYFLSEGLVGQFAIDKIETLVEKIKNLQDNSTKEDVDTIKKECDVIGEPFMKHKIVELLEGKIPKHLRKQHLENKLLQIHQHKLMIEKEIKDLQ